MEKWSEERIKAYIRYVKNDEIAISRWEHSLLEHKEGVERAESMIEATTKSMKKTLHELSQQEIYL